METVGNFSGNEESEALIQRGCYKGKKKLRNLLVFSQQGLEKNSIVDIQAN